MYSRVIPRDLFNEAKLLKCLGQLCLHIHNEQAGLLRFNHDTAEYPGFVIDQRECDGSFYCGNVRFYLPHGQVLMASSLNSKSPYPLVATYLETEEVRVFRDDGAFTEEFIELINATSTTAVVETQADEPEYGDYR